MYSKLFTQTLAFFVTLLASGTEQFKKRTGIDTSTIPGLKALTSFDTSTIPGVKALTSQGNSSTDLTSLSNLGVAGNLENMATKLSDTVQDTVATTGTKSFKNVEDALTIQAGIKYEFGFVEMGKITESVTKQDGELKKALLLARTHSHLEDKSSYFEFSGKYRVFKKYQAYKDLFQKCKLALKAISVNMFENISREYLESKKLKIDRSRIWLKDDDALKALDAKIEAYIRYCDEKSPGMPEKIDEKYDRRVTQFQTHKKNKFKTVDQDIASYVAQEASLLTAVSWVETIAFVPVPVTLQKLYIRDKLEYDASLFDVSDVVEFNKTYREYYRQSEESITEKSIKDCIQYLFDRLDYYLSPNILLAAILNQNFSVFQEKDISGKKIKRSLYSPGKPFNMKYFYLIPVIGIPFALYQGYEVLSDGGYVDDIKGRISGSREDPDSLLNRAVNFVMGRGDSDTTTTTIVNENPEETQLADEFQFDTEYEQGDFDFDDEEIVELHSSVKAGEFSYNEADERDNYVINDIVGSTQNLLVLWMAAKGFYKHIWDPDHRTDSFLKFDFVKESFGSLEDLRVISPEMQILNTTYLDEYCKVFFPLTVGMTPMYRLTTTSTDDEEKKTEYKNSCRTYHEYAYNNRTSEEKRKIFETSDYTILENLLIFSRSQRVQVAKLKNTDVFFNPCKIAVVVPSNPFLPGGRLRFAVTEKKDLLRKEENENDYEFDILMAWLRATHKDSKRAEESLQNLQYYWGIRIPPNAHVHKKEISTARTIQGVDYTDITQKNNYYKSFILEDQEVMVRPGIEETVNEGIQEYKTLVDIAVPCSLIFTPAPNISDIHNTDDEYTREFMLPLKNTDITNIRECVKQFYAASIDIAICRNCKILLLPYIPDAYKKRTETIDPDLEERIVSDLLEDPPPSFVTYAIEKNQTFDKQTARGYHFTTQEGIKMKSRSDYFEKVIICAQTSSSSGVDISSAVHEPNAFLPDQISSVGVTDSMWYNTSDKKPRDKKLLAEVLKDYRPMPDASVKSVGFGPDNEDFSTYFNKRRRETLSLNADNLSEKKKIELLKEYHEMRSVIETLLIARTFPRNSINNHLLKLKKDSVDKLNINVDRDSIFKACKYLGLPLKVAVNGNENVISGIDVGYVFAYGLNDKVYADMEDCLSRETQEMFSLIQNDKHREQLIQFLGGESKEKYKQNISDRLNRAFTEIILKAVAKAHFVSYSMDDKNDEYDREKVDQFSTQIIMKKQEEKGYLNRHTFIVSNDAIISSAAKGEIIILQKGCIPNVSDDSDPRYRNLESQYKSKKIHTFRYPELHEMGELSYNEQSNTIARFVPVNQINRKSYAPFPVARTDILDTATEECVGIFVHATLPEMRDHNLLMSKIKPSGDAEIQKRRRIFSETDMQWTIKKFISDPWRKSESPEKKSIEIETDFFWKPTEDSETFQLNLRANEQAFSVLNFDSREMPFQKFKGVASAPAAGETDAPSAPAAGETDAPSAPAAGETDAPSAPAPAAGKTDATSSPGTVGDADVLSAKSQKSFDTPDSIGGSAKAAKAAAPAAAAAAAPDPQINWGDTQPPPQPATPDAAAPAAAATPAAPAKPPPPPPPPNPKVDIEPLKYDPKDKLPPPPDKEPPVAAEPKPKVVSKPTVVPKPPSVPPSEYQKPGPMPSVSTYKTGVPPPPAAPPPVDKDYPSGT